MPIYKKIISTMCIGALCTSALYLNCFAASKQTDTGEIKISGNVNCKEAGHTVCIDVWAHGTGIKDLRNTAKRSEYTNYIAYRDEVLSTDNGEYNLLINLAPRKSGLYDVYVSCDCGEDIIKENVIFSDAEESKNAAALLNKAVADGTQAQKSVTEIADDIAKIVNEYNYSLGVGEEYTADTNAGTIIYNYIKNKPVSENDGNEAVKLCKKAAAISNISGGKITNLLNNADMLYLSDSRIKDLYTKKYVNSDFGEYLTKKLTGKEFNNLDSFYDELYKQFVFATIKMSNGYSNIQAAVDTFSEDIFGEAHTLSQSEALKLQSNDYSTYDEIVNALKFTPSTDGKKGGGKSGGSGGVGSSKYDDTYLDNQTPDKINQNIFDDIDSVSWAVESIVELAQKGIISGKGNRMFYPNDSITREEFVKIIALTFFENSAEADVTFNDVADGEWYAKYVKQAYGEGIINGVGYNMFGTGANITREDMAVIAYNTAVKTGKYNADDLAEEFAFDDDAFIADYAKEAVYKLYSAGIINGMGDGEYAPKQFVTRAQAAKIIYGIYNLK